MEKRDGHHDRSCFTFFVGWLRASPIFQLPSICLSENRCGRGPSHFVPKAPQNRDSPRQVSDRHYAAPVGPSAGAVLATQKPKAAGCAWAVSALGARCRQFYRQGAGTFQAAPLARTVRRGALACHPNAFANHRGVTVTCRLESTCKSTGAARFIGGISTLPHSVNRPFTPTVRQANPTYFVNPHAPRDRRLVADFDRESPYSAPR